MLRKKKTDSEGGGGTIIVVIFGICVCCVIMSILGAIAAYYFSIKKEAPFDKKLLEYRDKEGAHIIKSLPFDVKNAYRLDILPENNSKLTVIPQIITNSAEEFLFVSDYVQNYLQDDVFLGME